MVAGTGTRARGTSVLVALARRRPGGHHAKCDIVEIVLMRYQEGGIASPRRPGLAVRLDREKLGQHTEMYRRLGGYPYDQDPARPGWNATAPNDRRSDPRDGRPVAIPY